jgi:hypothetical protein
MSYNPQSVLSLLKQIDSLIINHYQERIEMELGLEVAPRDSRYSNQLITLMQREEAILREGKISSISNEIDNQLQAETKSFFAKVGQTYIKRWTYLLQNQTRQKEDLFDRIRQYVGSPREETNSKISVSALDLEIESLRLQELYNKNWYHYEGFHLHEAFQSQKDRINSEWDLHFNQLKDAYDKKVKQVTGDLSPHIEADAHNAGSDRWHHPEKQKTLIHTAPVLSPTAPKSSAAGSGVRAVRSSRGGREVQSELLTEEVHTVHTAYICSHMGVCVML